MNMDKSKPPDPPDIPSTPLSNFSPSPTPNPLSQFADVVCNLETQTPASQSNTRKRPGNEDGETNRPSKQPRTHVGRVRYSVLDKGPFIVHVSRQETQPNAGTVLHPVSFGRFLANNNISNITGIKRVGRNRVSVEFTSPQDANAFLANSTLGLHLYEAAIPSFNITRMGVVSGIPTEFSEDEVKTYLKVPAGCGPVLKIRRLNRKVSKDGISEYRPTETCVITFDGQVLPKKIFCFYTALPVEQYIYPTIQCRKCCRFGHVESLCRSKPRCIKCGNDHPGDGCSISESEAFCVLCSGSHFANSKACPEYGRQRSIKVVMAEKVLSYSEASKTVPNSSRSYADITKSQSQSYRKTVTLKPKTHAPLSPSYDKAAHQLLTCTPQSSQHNGCALNNQHLESPVNLSSIIELLIKLLTTLMSTSNSQSLQLPSNVANSLINALTLSNHNGSVGVPSMECEERVA